MEINVSLDFDRELKNHAGTKRAIKKCFHKYKHCKCSLFPNPEASNYVSDILAQEENETKEQKQSARSKKEDGNHWEEETCVEH